MKRLWSLLVGLALVGGGFVAWELAAGHANDLERLSDLLAFAFLSSGVTLLALWTALGTTRWAWRFARDHGAVPLSRRVRPEPHRHSRDSPERV